MSAATSQTSPTRSLIQSRAAAAALTELERRRAARTSLLGFTQYTFPRYQAAPHHRLICEKLEAVERGQCKRLMIFTPPRHGKSELVSRRFPPFCLGRNPDREIISASYGAELALDFGRDVRNIVGSREFPVLFSGVGLAADSAAKNRWHTNHGGGYVAAGVGTAITGRGADILNIDDPVKDRAEAESETIRESIWAWYRSTAYTRLMPGAAIILTMTRWHEDDLAGRLLEQAKADGDQWEVLNLPALAEGNDPLGRDVGAALWPQRYNETTLHQIRSVLEPREWGALYEQNPRPSGSSYFDVQKALVDGLPVEAPRICDLVYATIDTAVKTGSGNDGTAVIFWAKSEHIGHPLIVLDWDITQISGDLLITWLPVVFQRLEELAKSCRARYGSGGVWIEDKASGTILLQQAQRQDLPAQAIDSKLTAVGKDERAISISGYVSAGMVKIAQAAYDKVTTYKGRTGNHFLMQVFRFQIGVKDQMDDLLDDWAYGIAIGLGNAEGY